MTTAAGRGMVSLHAASQKACSLPGGRVAMHADQRRCCESSVTIGCSRCFSASASTWSRGGARIGFSDRGRHGDGGAKICGLVLRQSCGGRAQVGPEAGGRGQVGPAG